jgi:hypothetical protein
MTRELTPKSPSGRVKRNTLGVRNRLSVKDKDPNYFYRIVNTTDKGGADRLEWFLDRGYEIDPVNNGNVGDKRVDAAVGVGSTPDFSVGQGTRAVVMRQKKEYYEEDQATKMDQIKKQEDAMYENARRDADFGIMSPEGFRK